MDKSPDAFRTITEVAEDLSVPQHVLRFWETRFANIKPLKRGGGRRYYRPDDVDLLRGIQHLLYGEGYTIKGVQRLLKEKGPRFVQGIRRGDERAPIRSAADGEEGAGERDEAAEEVASAAQPRPGRQISSDRRRDASTGELGNRGASLAQDDIDRLRSALDELLECERVLTTLRARDDPGGSDEAAA